MTYLDFADWLSRQGCQVTITQDDDGSGYICLDVTTPDGQLFDITVTS